MPRSLYASILLAQGEDTSHVVTRIWEEPTDPLAEPDTPIDVTGWTFHATVRATPDAASSVLDWTTGQFDIDGPYGMVIPVTSAATIAALAPFVGWFDLFGTDPSGNRQRLRHGEFSVLSASTRNP